MAGDGGDRRHREREKSGDDRFEGDDHVVEAVDGGGRRTGGLSPGEVEAVGEETAVCGGDEDGAGSGLRFDLGEKREEGGDESGIKAVVVVAGEG